MKIKYRYILAVIAASIFFNGCEEQPSDLGFNYVSPIDTLGTHILSSDTDTMTIGISNFKYRAKLNGSPNILIGRYQTYESKGLLKFNNLPDNYDSAVVNSAVLKLKYANYYFKDSLGTVDFTVNRITRQLDFNTITFDSVMTSDFSAVSSGNFSGNPADTNSVYITLDNQLVKDWFEYAANNSYTPANYGIGFLPNGSSTSIKGFFSSAVSGLQPSLQVVVTKNGDTDTLNFSENSSTSIADGSLSSVPNERFLVQSGVAFRTLMTFDLAKLPPNVIINDAQIQLSLDEPASFISTNYSNRIGIAMMLDTAAKKDTFQVVPSSQTFINDVYTIKITPYVQNWNISAFANNGLTLFAGTENQTLDQFMFYSINASDVTRRPKLRIIYTVRK